MAILLSVHLLIHDGHIVSLSSQALNYKYGVVTTGNSLDHVPADDAIMATNGEYPTITHDMMVVARHSDQLDL